MNDRKKPNSVPLKTNLHPENRHRHGYDFESLVHANPDLEPFVFTNEHGTRSTNFSSPEALLQLNRALLKNDYQVCSWSIPAEYLCPAIPGRADYIHYLADLLSEDGISATPAKPIVGLDVGVGASCIYPILGAQIYGWTMVGSDIHEQSVASARVNASASAQLHGRIEIRHQEDNAHIFEGVILENEHFHFTMCNPPFHASEEDASKATLRKLQNLQGKKLSPRERIRNFGGQANELWCNGGEALFIKRMIKQSVAFKSQVTWFTTLVSKSDNLKKITKQLKKLKAIHRTVPMSQGRKKSRFVAWKFC